MFFANLQPCLQEVARLQLTIQFPIIPQGSVRLGDLAPSSEAHPSPHLQRQGSARAHSDGGPEPQGDDPRS